MKHKRFLAIFEFGLMLLCMAELAHSDAYYSPYLIVFAAALICAFINFSRGCSAVGASFEKGALLPDIFAAAMAMMICLANYMLWLEAEIPSDFCRLFRAVYKLFKLAVLLGGAYIAFRHIMQLIKSELNRLVWTRRKGGIRSGYVFLICFALIAGIDLAVMLLCQYPGELTPDSIWQLEQILSGVYSNHHPLYHTLVIKLCVGAGLRLFGSLNAGVACYSVFQIFFMAGCFSFAVSTLHRLGAPRFILILSIAFFALMPYNIMYSFTMWKDIMFGGFVLLFIVFALRYFMRLDRSAIDLAMLALTGIGICLFRSNGFLVFLVTVLCFAFIWGFKEKKLLAVLLLSLLVSLPMKSAAIKLLDAQTPDILEPLSIPLQQLAYVIKTDNDLNEHETELVEAVVDISQVPDRYLCYISDPIKELIRETGDPDAISQNKAEYFKLWLSVGLRHPKAYVTSWIEQTKGYWNSGYNYWIWADRVEYNDLEIYRLVFSPAADRMLTEYLWLFTQVPLLQIFISTGLCFWLNVLLLYIAIIRRDRLTALFAIPSIAIVATLLVATPVYAEFRYVYALFCALPFIISIAFRPIKTETGELKNG